MAPYGDINAILNGAIWRHMASALTKSLASARSRDIAFAALLLQYYMLQYYNPNPNPNSNFDPSPNHSPNPNPND